jgi:hypothetical protein
LQKAIRSRLLGSGLSTSGAYVSFPEKEFEESIRDFGMTRFYARSLLVTGVVVTVAGIAAIVAGERDLGIVMLVAGPIVSVGAFFGLRWVGHMESDPSARNPRRNPVARGLFAWEKKHPVLSVVVGALLLVLAVWLRLR